MKNVIFDGNEVIVEEITKVQGLFGEQKFVNRRRMNRDEYAKEARQELNNQLGGLVIAGIIAGGALLLQKAMGKDKKDNSFKLPWSK